MLKKQIPIAVIVHILLKNRPRGKWSLVKQVIITCGVIGYLRALPHQLPDEWFHYFVRSGRRYVLCIALVGHQ